MCITCGCESINITKQTEPHHHAHEHHAQPNHHDETPKNVHHHYYHNGDVHHHYHIYSDQPVHEHKHGHKHTHGHEHSHEHSHNHDHDHQHHNEQPATSTEQRLIEIEQNVLSKNNHIADHNRHHFAEANILALNLVSSPGSGKTTLLTETLIRLSAKHPCAVIEGDQQTSNDADRIRKTGVPVIQVNTGKGCHLDAQMVHGAMHELDLQPNSMLFIENVGNLVCPASFDLGEKLKVVVISVTEGDDKPLKYPHMFAAAGLMIINKIDLIEHVNFNIQACINNARSINPNLQVIELSCTSGKGLDQWLNWLEAHLCA